MTISPELAAGIAALEFDAQRLLRRCANGRPVQWRARDGRLRTGALTGRRRNEAMEVRDSMGRVYIVAAEAITWFCGGCPPADAYGRCTVHHIARAGAEAPDVAAWLRSQDNFSRTVETLVREAMRAGEESGSPPHRTLEWNSCG